MISLSKFEQEISRIKNLPPAPSPLFDGLHQRLRKNHPHVLFGASLAGRNLIEKMNEADLSVDYFCDSSETLWGQDVVGVPVISPDELQKLNDPDVIISSSYQSEIAEYLSDLGISNIIHFPLVDIITDQHYDVNYHYNQLEKILSVYELLDNEQSRDVMLNVMLYRFSRDLKCISKVRTNDMYLPLMIRSNLSLNSVVYDVGAFDGDTVELFLNEPKEMLVHAFEPEKNNYNIIQTKFSNNTRVIPVQLALSNKSETVYINDDGCGSKIVVQGDASVQAIQSQKLDDYTKMDGHSTPNYIKMDVEGYEKKVLLGARSTIEKKKPLLAISIYHYASDLWRLPLLINKFNKDYKMGLRHHSYNICDTVLYCY